MSEVVREGVEVRGKSGAGDWGRILSFH
jgi:hypothetical protein